MLSAQFDLLSKIFGKFPKFFELSIICACMSFGGLLSFKYGKDRSWDLLNYHFYNPYAFLEGRFFWDIGPAQKQSFFNPIADVPFYLLVENIQSQVLITFIMGAFHGVAIYFLLKISWLMLSNYTLQTRSILTGMVLVVGLTGTSALPTIGRTLNDWYVAIFVLASLYIVLRSLPNLENSHQHMVKILMGGILCGIAFGVKLPAAIYIIGIGLALFIIPCNFKIRLKIVTAFGIGVAIGIIITSGYWMWQLWEAYDNPIFPFFNNIFQSEYWELKHPSDKRFVPTSIMQWLFYPFYWVVRNKHVGEHYMIDFRFALIAIFSLVALIAWIKKANLSSLKQSSTSSIKSNITAEIFLYHRWRLLFSFFIATYVVWLYVFSIYRYMATAELLSGLIIIGILSKIFATPRNLIIAAIVVTLLLLITTERSSWGRAYYHKENEYFPVKPLPLPPKSLIVMSGGSPMSYLIPRSEKQSRFVTIRSNLVRMSHNNKLVLSILQIIKEHDGPIFVMIADRNLAQAKEDLVKAGLNWNEESCTEHGLYKEVLLCEAIKLSSDKN